VLATALTLHGLPQFRATELGPALERHPHDRPYPVRGAVVVDSCQSLVSKSPATNLHAIEMGVSSRLLRSSSTVFNAFVRNSGTGADLRVVVRPDSQLQVPRPAGQAGQFPSCGRQCGRRTVGGDVEVPVQDEGFSQALANRQPVSGIPARKPQPVKDRLRRGKP